MAHRCRHGSVCFCNADLDEEMDSDETPEWCACECDDEFDDEIGEDELDALEDSWED